MGKKTISSTLSKPDYIIFGFLLLFPVITVFINVWAAIAQLVLATVYAIYIFVSKKNRSERLYNHLQSITLYLDEASKESLTRFPMPVTLLDSKGDIIWYNDLFNNLLEQNKMSEVFGKSIDVLVPQFAISDELVTQKHEVSFMGRHYSTFVMRQGDSSNEIFYSVYWIDNTNIKNELYGMDRLGAILNKVKDGTPDEILPAVKKDIDEFVGEAPQFDDITMLCLEYKARMEKREDDVQ